MTPPALLTETIRKLMANYSVPGASIDVFDPQGVTWSAGIGTRERDSDAPVESNTLFQCASLSKPVAAMAALALVQQGKLSLDENVNAKLIAWKVPESPSTRTQKVTLRRLLSHTAGVSHHSVGSYMAGEDIPTAVQILNGAKPARNSPVQIFATPGSTWKYSGGGYVILQQLVSDVTELSFAEAVSSLVLDPAGMRASSFAQPLPDSLINRASFGHVDGVALTGGSPVVPALAAGGLWTTAPDLRYFLQFLIAAAAGTNCGIISQTLAQEMLTLHHPNPYGLGLMLLGRPIVATVFGHGGNNRGFESFAFADVRSGRSTVVLANSNTQGKFRRAVFAEIHKNREIDQIELDRGLSTD